jgi:protein SCO1/2
MQRLLALIAVLLLGSLLLWLLLGWQPSAVSTDAHRQLDLQSRPTGGDFELISAAGPWRLSDHRGQVVLLYFGYSACPDICPTNLAIIALALRSLSAEELERVRVVFVSLDPERDSPARLAEYVAFFHPAMIGVTGSEEAVAAAASAYGAAYRRVDDASSAMSYSLDHSAYSYVIDGSGALVEVIDHATPAEEIATLIRRELNARDERP